MRGMPKPRDGHRNPWDPKHLDFVAWMREFHLKALATYPGRPLEGPVGFECRLYFVDDRRGDADNVGGAVADALEGVLFGKDRQIVDWRARVVVGCDKPRIEVDVWPMPDEANRHGSLHPRRRPRRLPAPALRR